MTEFNWKSLISHWPLLILAGMLLAAAAIWFSNARVERVAEGRVFTREADVPVRRVGLVLGCAEQLADGRENLFFHYRIDLASQLFQESKVEYLIVSGDNSRPDYDEPSAMRRALMERGVPAEAIYRDYAGFSTLDSVVRAREIFGQDDLLVISQDFHVRRAIYIAREHGIKLIGASARDVSGRNGIRTYLREYFARVKTMLDVHVLHRDPHFLGERIEIGRRV